VIVADENLRPLRPALMWDDKRPVAEAEECAAAGAELCAELGYRFRPTFSLPKMLWINRNEPAVWERVRYACHATDWLASCLTHEAPVTDYTNALKTGFDLIRECWPAYIDELGIDRALLPPVVPAGTPVGTVHPSVAEATGLPSGVQVVAGMTDANTAQVASGAFGLGQWVTTIGTGLSLKGVSKTIIKDPHGALYCHRHPDGYWIPSGTSHSGADAIVARFPNEDLARLTEAAQTLPPAKALVFPLPRKGEFFPFWAPEATGFEIGDVDDEITLFRSCLEGIAYIERLSLDVARSLGAVVVGPITTMGGGSRSALWRQIRADVMGRPVRAVENPDTALGAALVALTPGYGSITDIASAAASYVGDVEPRPRESGIYAGAYVRFLEELVRRGYLEPQLLAYTTHESSGE
jgi:sugar (pentulose or hexulose) kinase